MNLIARAKLGSHLRPRSVQFFNILGIIKNKLWDHRIVWWFCSQIFFAHFRASFASSSASATPKGDPGLRSGLRSLGSYIRYENLSKNHQKSWISQLFLRSPMLKNWRNGSYLWDANHPKKKDVNVRDLNIRFWSKNFVKFWIFPILKISQSVYATC